MNARIRKKYLRNAERLLANACRLYKARPRGDAMDEKLKTIADSLLSLSLEMAFYDWCRHGPSRPRQLSFRDVEIDSVEEFEKRIVLAGSVRWSRRQAGQETELEERFRIDCAVPSLRKTPKWVRPTVVLQIADGSAA